MVLEQVHCIDWKGAFPFHACTISANYSFRPSRDLHSNVDKCTSCTRMRIHSQALVADDAPAPLQDPDVQCTNQFILVDLCSVLQRSFGCPHLLIGLMIAGDCATYRVVVVVVVDPLLLVVVLPSLVCHVFPTCSSTSTSTSMSSSVSTLTSTMERTLLLWWIFFFDSTPLGLPRILAPLLPRLLSPPRCFLYGPRNAFLQLPFGIVLFFCTFCDGFALFIWRE